MVIPNVPFYSNTPDDTHCLQAVLKMVLKYFEPEKDYSFEELDKLSDKVEGKWTWATRALINMHKMGYELINMESFDYLEFSKTGVIYLNKKFGHEYTIAQNNNCDIPKEMVDAVEYAETFGNSYVLPEITDIKKYIDLGYLIGCNINAEKLNNNPGYTGHFVLIFGYNDSFLYLHDPGSPPYANRKILFNDFISAWAYPNHDNQNMTAFKLK